MSCAGVVLAAGRSARMGMPKALLDFRGAPFVVRIIEACVALELKYRLVVLGPDASRIRRVLATQDCLILENPDVDAGPISSLRVALNALKATRPRAVLAWPVDLPHVRIASIQRLLDVHDRTRAPAVVPMFGGRRGHPVIWDERMFDEIASSEEASRSGARAVLHAHADAIREVPVDDPAVIDTVNTPEDYERLVRQINRDAF